VALLFDRETGDLYIGASAKSLTKKWTFRPRRIFAEGLELRVRM